MLLGASRSSFEIHTTHPATERTVRHKNVKRESAHTHLRVRVLRQEAQLSSAPAKTSNVIGNTGSRARRTEVPDLKVQQFGLPLGAHFAEVRGNSHYRGPLDCWHTTMVC